MISMKNLWKRALTRRPEWEYGICNGEPARRSRKTGEVQFMIWKAGEMGHVSDRWVPFNAYWWPTFKLEGQK